MSSTASVVSIVVLLCFLHRIPRNKHGRIPRSILSFPCCSRVLPWLLLILRPAHGLGLGEQVAELGVVHLHAIIEVDADLLLGGVLQLFLEGQKFRLLLFEIVLILLEPIAVAGAGRLGLVAFELLDAGGDAPLPSHNSGDTILSFSAIPGTPYLISCNSGDTILNFLELGMVSPELPGTPCPRNSHR